MRKAAHWLGVALILIATAALLVMLKELVVAALHSYLGHPLGDCTGTVHQQELCKGYNFWSGISGDFSEFIQTLSVLSLTYAFWRHHNCHIHGCPWVSMKTPDTNGLHVCKGHHSHGKVTEAEHLTQTGQS